MRRSIRNAAVAVALALTLSTVGITAAQANPSSYVKPVATQAELSAFEAHLGALAVSESKAAISLAQFKSLSQKEQVRFVAIVTSADPFSAPGGGGNND